MNSEGSETFDYLRIKHKNEQWKAFEFHRTVHMFPSSTDFEWIWNCFISFGKMRGVLGKDIL